jgi:two-component sensor histidine kinase
LISRAWLLGRILRSGPAVLLGVALACGVADASIARGQGGAPPMAWALPGLSAAVAVAVILVASVLVNAIGRLKREVAALSDGKAQLQTLVGELAHRNRNALFVIMSIVSQSARDAPSAAAAEELINARLAALLRAQEVVVGSDGGSASLGPLIERALEPFGLERFEIAPSPEVQIEADVAIGLGLLFHELATNALKYGALSAASGRILVEWTLEAGVARFAWREVGGPAVAEPSKKGFGARLLEFALVPQGGKAERRFEPDGLICELHIPTPPEGPRPEPASPPGALFAGV